MRIDRWLALVALVRLAACAPPDAKHAASDPAPPIPTAGVGADAATPARSAVPAPSQARIAADVRTAAGGLGGLDDHIGPEALAALLGRLRAHSSAYLAEIRSTFLADGTAFEEQADLWLADVLAELYPGAPAEAARLASALQDAYARTVVTLPRGAAREKLEAHVRALEIVRGGIDVAAGPTWRTQTPDEICVTTIPGRERRAAFLVRRDCTCGEVLACKVSSSGRSLRVETLVDPTHFGCTDCTRATTTCTVPGLAPSTRYEVVAARRAFGSISTGPGGLPQATATCMRVGSP